MDSASSRKIIIIIFLNRPLAKNKTTFGRLIIYSRIKFSRIILRWWKFLNSVQCPFVRNTLERNTLKVLFSNVFTPFARRKLKKKKYSRRIIVIFEFKFVQIEYNMKKY